MNQRPTGVTILAILAFVGGVFGVLGGLALFGFGAVFAAYTGGGLAFFFGIVLIALSIVELYIGYGFWTLKRTAWSLGLVVFGASLIIQFVEIPLGYNDVGSFVVTLVIYGAVLYYLLTPGVKAAFGVTGGMQEAVMSGLPMVGGAAASAPPAAPPAEPAAYTPPPPPAAAPYTPPAAEPPASSWSAPTESAGASTESASSDMTSEGGTDAGGGDGDEGGDSDDSNG